MVSKNRLFISRFRVPGRSTFYLRERYVKKRKVRKKSNMKPDENISEIEYIFRTRSAYFKLVSSQNNVHKKPFKGLV